MAKKLSVEILVPDHQVQLVAKTALFPTVYDASNYAVKGSDKVSFPILNATEAEDLDLSASDTITGADLNYTKDSLEMTRAAAKGFEIDENEEEENAMRGVEDGVKGSLEAIARGLDRAIYTRLKTTTYFVVPTASIQDDFINLNKALDDRNVPETDRFFACNSADYAKLLKVRDFVALHVSGNNGIQTGVIGTLYGVSIVKTNVVSAESIMYHKSAVAIAKHGEMKIKVQDAAYEMSAKHAIWQKYGTKLLQAGKLAVRLAAS